MSKITVLCISVVDFVQLATESIFTHPNSFKVMFLDMIGCYYQIASDGRSEAQGGASVSSTALFSQLQPQCPCAFNRPFSFLADG